MSEEPVDFWSHTRQRIIVVSTMERDVRVAFIAGSALVVLAIALNIFKEHLGPQIHISVGTIPVAAVAALGLGEFAVFFLISLAMMLLRGRWRYIAQTLTLIAFIAFAAMADFDLLSFALVVPAAMLWVFSQIGERQNWTDRDYSLAALSVSLMAMVIFLLYVATGRDELIVSALAWQGLLAMLGLCMAATDIAEVAIVAVESVTAKLAKFFRSSRAALAFAFVAIIANVLVTLMTTDWSSRAVARYLGAGLGLALWLGLIYWMVISRRRRLGSVSPNITYGALIAVVGLYFFALQAGIAWRVLSDPVSYRAANLFTYPRVFVFTTLGALAFIVMFFVFGRRSKQMLTSLAYGVSVGMFIFHYYSSQGDNIVLIIDAVAMGSVLFLIFARLSHKLRERYALACLIVADLNLTFVAYALLATLFASLGEHGHGGSGLSVGQALIVLAALGWDILSSGDAITNRHTDSFPRLARVAIFISYIMSVALLVMVVTAGEYVNPFNGEATVPFNSEVLVAVGLVLFGAPFIFVTSALRLRNLLATADAQAAVPFTGSDQPTEVKFSESGAASLP